MAYMQAAGLGRFRFRRGLGRGMGTLQDLSPDDPILQDPNQGTTYGARSGGTFPVNPYTGMPGGSQSLTSWLNQNAGAVALGAGALFFFAMAVKR